LGRLRISGDFSVARFKDYISSPERMVMAECRDSGVYLKKIAQRFRDSHTGLKTRVRIYLESISSDVDVRPVEIPLFKMELVKEVGEYVTFELAHTF